mgnify:CR=1 FL=1
MMVYPFLNCHIRHLLFFNFSMDIPKISKAGVFLFLMLGMFAFQSKAQTGSIRGFVYDKSNGEPAIFTTVYLKGTTIGTVTDVNGYFNISKLTPGTYTLMVTALGYDTLRLPFTVTSDELISRKLFLVKNAINIKAVDVSAEKQE